MKIYILSSVRQATLRERAKLEAYANILEDKGYEVYLPHRDTNQQDTEFDICFQNGAEIQRADEVHVFYNPKSTGSHFDLGVLFAFDALSGNRTRIRLITGDEHASKQDKNFVNMIRSWQEYQEQVPELYKQTNETDEENFQIAKESFAAHL